MTPRVFLRKEVLGWSIITASGHKISGPRQCNHDGDALEWARNFVSTWGWTIELEGENDGQEG